jgi:hypothetical protein
MNPIHQTIRRAGDAIDTKFETIAIHNLPTKSARQGVDFDALDEQTQLELLRKEVAILQSDAKKVGVGIGIGLLISAVTGF